MYLDDKDMTWRGGENGRGEDGRKKGKKAREPEKAWREQKRPRPHGAWEALRTGLLL